MSKLIRFAFPKHLSILGLDLAGAVNLLSLTERMPERVKQRSDLAAPFVGLLSLFVHLALHPVREPYHGAPDGR